MLCFKNNFSKIVIDFLFSKNHFKGAVHFLFSKNHFKGAVHFLFSKNHFNKTAFLFFVHFSLSVSAVAENSLSESVRTLLLETSPHQQSEIEKLEISSCSAACVSFKTFSQGEAEFQLVIDTSKSEPELSFTRDSRTLSLPSLSYLEELINSARVSNSSRVSFSSHVSDSARISNSSYVSPSSHISDSVRVSDSSPASSNSSPASSNSSSASSNSSSSPASSMSTLVHRWLVGHELHPYSASEFSLKPSQVTALEASRIALKEHRPGEGETSSLLNIAPTGSGKTLVLAQTLMEQIETYSENKKLFIVTADRVHLVDQLHSQIQGENKEKRTIKVVNWGTLNDKSWQGLAQLSQMAQEGEGATVLVITSQSLKLKLSEFFTQTEKKYKNLQESFVRSVGGIYIDEAHHLGARETRKEVLDLVARSEAFLYGATATPVHHEVNLRDFFKREHWTYLNTNSNLFERHGTDAVLEQLSIGIKRGELTPFDELYVIGEQTFKDLEEERKNNNNNDRTNSTTTNNNTSNRTNDSSTTTNNDTSNRTNDSSTTTTNNSNIQKTDLPSVSASVSAPASVFMQAESAHYVLNPAYYESLLRIIAPILSANRKGFIVTATIAEAKRLTEFLNNSVSGIEFDVLHSQMEEQERRKVLNRSVHSTGSHYIVSVRMLDEGINLPHLSAYIDLNFNVSIKQMIHRIGRVLRLYPNKLTSDVLFLIDYRDEQKARDALSILDQIKNISFKGGEIRNKETRRGESGDVHLLYEGTGIRPMSRADLEEMREKLPDSILKRRFWRERYTLEQIPAAIERINESLLEPEKIRNTRTYNAYLKREDRDQRLPSLTTVAQWYQNRHSGDGQRLIDYILGRESRSVSDKLKEVPGLVSRINQSLPTKEKIKDRPTYEKYLKREDRDQRLSPLTTVGKWYKKKHGHTRGMMDFIIGRESRSVSDRLKEVPGLVSQINQSLPAKEKIRDGPTYEKYYKREDRDQRLPSLSTVGYWYREIYSDKQGMMDFILGRELKPRLYLEEIPDAVRRINASLPVKDKIRSTRTYEKYCKREDRDQRLPLLATVGKWYKKKHGNTRGMMDFILGRESRSVSDRLKEVPGLVSQINQSLPTKEKIKDGPTYEKYLKREDRDQRLPPLSTVTQWHEKKHGHQRGVMDYILSESNLPKSYTLEEVPGAVARINESLSEEEKIRSEGTYKNYLKREDRDPRLPPIGIVKNWYKKIHGDGQGMMNYILGRESKPKPYSYEEIPAVVSRINASLLESEKIRNVPTYKEYLKREDRDKRLPSLQTVAGWYKREHGHQRGVMDFILGRELKPKPYSYEEIPGAVARINEGLPESEKIRDGPTYEKYYKREDRDKRLPSFPTVARWYKKKHGHKRGVMNFIRSGSCQKGFSASP